ncbi:LexA family transcriptional regulator [Lacibacter sp. H375]|jgi:transcriptional regulator with XRE-family HTH domain|uniref:XRE family transcriptional regulator n=1 Tax=unclassified Lacibacter TaxID=2630913 RepID=UPI002B4B37C5|nr:LexA family transcriptional regulator [Lacibacter sp.]HLP38757.1 LexA family transcriptional regulator [Lacibacter sp.]
MAVANQNLKYLRKLRGWTQEEFAQKIGIKRSLVGAYEEERAEPNYEVLETVSDLFKVSIDDLLRKDLSETKGSYLAKRRQLKMIAETNVIHFVPVKAAAGYLNGYADPEFLDELNTFTLPMLAGGTYRAFEIVGDSMLPTPSGSVIVGEKVHNLDDVKNNNAYIILSKSEGVVYKRVLKSNRTKNKLTLVSDNPVYQPYQVNAEDVLEFWSAQMVLSRVNQGQRWDVTNLASLVSNLQDQVNNLKKKMN